jgi:hypothetical protein
VSLVLRSRVELVPTDRGGRRRYMDPTPQALRDLAAAKTRELRAP